MFTETIYFSTAFLEGLLSFFTPCILPLVPAYFTFITGFSLEELTESGNAEIRKKVILSTLSFVSGFSIVFILLGASATLLGGLVSEYSDWIRIGGSIIIILFGIHLTGIIHFKGLDFEKKLHLQNKPVHFGGTLLIGMAFGAGWSPCIGPILGSILSIAMNQDTVWQGMGLLAVYSAGLAMPFIFLSVFINLLIVFIRKMNKVVRYVNISAGVLLIIVGLLLLTNKMSFLYTVG
ncbi:MAG: cytochrome c biogenesis protein CcdA [Desulfobacteraceae bacterium]|jgi:cytochrome c-type biogenesis protein|nr:cytochrome c biogenesis protein CcdA [Desulfobacteraceae bacterium]